VKLIGVLASAAGQREFELVTSSHPTISDLVSTLLAKFGNRQFHDFLVDSGTGDPRPNVIILVDDQDCNLLGGMNARLEEGALVTVIPVAHGG
jgi:molybdopterin converting factor small subunit